MDPIAEFSLITVLIHLGVSYLQLLFFGGPIDIHIPETAFAEVAVEAPLQIVEKDFYASCVVYEIQDNAGNVIEVPEEVIAALDCGVMLSITPDYSGLMYEFEGHIKLLNFQTTAITEILAIEPDIDGISNVFWAPDGDRFGFVEIDQQDFPSLTRVHIVDLKEGTMSKHQTFDQKIRFSCGSICTTDSENDIWFENHEILRYYTYENDPYEDLTNNLIVTLPI